MKFCRKFINGIDSINFVGPSSDVLKKLLIVFAYQELKREHEQLLRQLSDLPEGIPDNFVANEQLEEYKKKQREFIEQIVIRMSAISDEYNHSLELSVEPIIDDLPAFIKLLAQNFRDIKHLAYTLSDAPSTIKKLQTQLYIEVLSKLEHEEQEVQLQTLSLSNIQDMITQAISLYENNSHDVQLGNQCQRIVHMGFYEIIRRDCNNVSLKSESNKYIEYQQVIGLLHSKLINVNQSPVIDNLSQYKASNGKSIGDLLVEAEKKLQIGITGDWSNDERINAFKARKELFHALRFGQEDRREYAKKTQANLIRDLFWARNIRDMELFTKSKVTDDVFASLAQKRYLQEDVVFKVQKEPKAYTPGQDLKFIKFQDILAEVYQGAKDKGLKKGGNTDKFNASEPKIEQHIKDTFKKQCVNPIVKLLPNGEIEVNFSYFNCDEAFAKKLIDIIGKNGGFRRVLEKALMDVFLKESTVTSKVQGVSLRGRSLVAIERQIVGMTHSGELSEEQAQAFLEQLATVKSQINKTQVSEISHLNLDNSDELLVRKLLELYSVYGYQQVKDAFNAPTPAIKSHVSLTLETAFKHLQAGHFKQALELSGLDGYLNDAYQKLSQLNPSEAAESVKPIIEKSIVISSSARERQELSEELENAFKSGSDIAKKVEAIFLKEYRSMVPTLNLKTPEEITYMEEQVKIMAEEMSRLYERTEKGEPSLTGAEQDAYFSILKEIATAIKPADISGVQFKVQHSVTGQFTVKVSDEKGQQVASVSVDIGGIKLPYSLVKPAGGDFIFSYGGSRGIIAPFEGLDEAYRGGEKKGRLFTHSKLLGVGQYGSVKEVESLLSGLNQIIKKGYVPNNDAAPTFQDTSRNDLRTRPITARDDPLYRIESDILQNYSRAAQEKYGLISGGTQYWIKNDKARMAGRLFSKTGTPRQYLILTERAKGETYADTANKKLNLYTKADIAYHDPIKRGRSSAQEALDSLKESLELSQEIVREAQRFADLGFSHNDIKPENFLYKKNPDGSYQVKYIDWATGGFERIQEGQKSKSVAEVFAEIFGADLPNSTNPEGNKCVDASGRYIEKSDEGFRYGVDPTLQILHGARNGTLPYISPTVLGHDRSVQPASDSIPKPELNTVLKNSQPDMDDWALTTMIFGICNRQAYFTLVKGRAVTDYIVPGILDIDGKKPLGLKIVDVAKFNQYFACGMDVIQESDVYSNKDAVMYIPSNQREGEPLHLYRRLQMIQDSLRESLRAQGEILEDNPEHQILNDINAILTRVRSVVGSGEGFNKIQLKDIIAASQQCIKRYENLHNLGYKQSLEHAETLQAIFNEHARSNLRADELLVEVGELKRMDILCTYPKTKEQIENAIAILDQAIDEPQFSDKFIGEHAPFRSLLAESISTGQNQILNSLLGKITQPNQAFIGQVKANGLLHYAAEQGMTDVFSNLIKALTKAGATSEELFELMMTEYGPTKQVKTAPYIKWSTNGFHIAIRNNNKEQLTTILNLLPKGHAYDEFINQALHLCAVLGNKDLFNQILTKYNELNSGVVDQINPQKMLKLVFPPDGMSPYHLFLADENTLEAIPFAQLQAMVDVAKIFLLKPPVETNAYPLLIAAKNGNYSGVKNLIQLADDISLSKAEFTQLFTQRDEEGKNLFNYILEQGQYTVLTAMLAHIKAKCEEPEKVLVHLLSNPHPVNPLRNFLNSEKSETNQFKILNQLFDEISPDFRTKELQQCRIVALLVNKDWLIEKASNSNSHPALRDLLHNDKLSTELKLGLFKKLVDDASEDTAKKFYSKLLKEITPRVEIDVQVVALNLPVKILQEVARQGNDLNSLIATLVPDQDLLNRLREQVQSLTQEQEKLGELLLAEQSTISQTKEMLRVQARQLDLAEDMVRKLRAEGDTKAFAYTSKVDELQLTLAKNDEQSEKAAQILRETQEQHQLDLEQLERRLLLAENARKQVVDDLVRVQEQLEEQVLAVRGLEHQVVELSRQNQFLRLELQSSQQNTAEVGGELALHQKAAESAQLAAQSTLNDLKSLQEEHARLRDKALQLEEANRKLSSQVVSLEARVDEFSEEQAHLHILLRTEQETVTQSKEMLRVQAKLLESAEVKVRLLQEEAEATVLAHARRVEELQSAIAQNDDHSEEAARVLRETQEQHELVLRQLEQRLRLAESAREQVVNELTGVQSELEEQVNAVRRLEQDAGELTRQNQALRLELQTSHQSTEEVRRELSERLALHQKAAESAQLVVQSTLNDLRSLEEEHAGLHDKALQLEEANRKLSSHVMSLEARVDEFSEEQARLHILLRTEQETVTQSKEMLRVQAKQLESAEVRVRLLQEEAEATVLAHARRVEELQSAIAQNDDHSEEAARVLRETQEQHQLVLRQLEQRLRLAESAREQVVNELTGVQSELEEQVNAVRRLEQDAVELTRQNQALRLELQTSYQSTEKVRRDLSEKLALHQKAADSAQLAAQSTLNDLRSLQEEHAGLHDNALQLEEANRKLSSQVMSLEARVDELSEEQARLHILLRTEQETVTQSKEMLRVQAKQLESAEVRVRLLQEEAEATVLAHARRVEELQSAIAQNDDHSEEAARVLRETQEQHQLVLRQLEQRLRLAESAREQVVNELTGVQSELEEQVNAVRRLEQDAVELTHQNQALRLELQTSYQSTEKVRRELSEKLALHQKAADSAQLAAQSTLNELKSLQEEHAGLHDKALQLEEANRKLSSQVMSLEARVDELSEEQAHLHILLRTEQETVTQSKEMLRVQAKQLESAEVRVRLLQEEAEATVLAHARRVEELQSAIAQNDDHSEEAARVLRETQEQHQLVLRQLEQRLRLAESAREQVMNELTGVQSELEEQVNAVRRLEQDAVELTRQNQALRLELQTSHHSTEKVRRELSEKLALHQKAADSAQLAAQSTLNELKSLQEEHARLRDKALQLEESNLELSAKVIQLEEAESRVQAEAHLKQLEIKRLTGLLGTVARQKAILSLRAVIESSNNLVLLRIVATAKSKEELIGVGLNPAEVKALGNVPSAFTEINKTGRRRLAALEKNAIAVLKEQVGVGGEALLLKVKLATSNEDLEAAGLDKKQIAFLKNKNFYTHLLKIAVSRLDQNQKAIVAIKAIIEKSIDVEFLKTLAKATKNEHLTIGLPHQYVKDLVNPDVYRIFVVLANERLQKLEASQTKAMPNVPKKANLLIEKDGFLGFKDDKVKRDQLDEGLPKCESSYEADTEVGPLIKGTLGVYKGTRVENEEVARSQKVFKSSGQDKVTGVALLVQDQTGRVVDKSYGKFDLQQKTDIALRQAQMFLLNYNADNQKRSKKEIYLWGPVAGSSKVFAALLYLKHNDPTLADVVIKSSTSGFAGPRYNWYTRNKVSEQNFIKKHLDMDFLTQKGKLVSEQSAQTRKVLYSAEKGKSVPTSTALLKNLYEGDELSAEGDIRKISYQEAITVLNQQHKAKVKVNILLNVFEEDISDIENDKAFRVATLLHKRLNKLKEEAFKEPIDFDALKQFSEQSKVVIEQAIPVLEESLGRSYLDNLSKEIGIVIEKMSPLTSLGSLSLGAEKRAYPTRREHDRTDENMPRNGLS